MITLLGTPALGGGGTIGDNTDVYTTSYAVEAGSDALVVQLEWTHYGALPSVDSVTFNGIALTPIANTLNTFPGGNSSAHQQFILTAADGLTATTANIIVTLSDQAYGCQWVASSWSGVDQSTPAEGGNFADGLTGGASHSIEPTTTTVNDNMLLGMCATTTNPDNQTEIAPSSGSTELGEMVYGSYEITTNCAYSSSSGSGDTVDWTNPNNENWATNVFVLIAATSMASLGEAAGVASPTGIGGAKARAAAAAAGEAAAAATGKAKSRATGTAAGAGTAAATSGTATVAEGQAAGLAAAAAIGKAKTVASGAAAGVAAALATSETGAPQLGSDIDPTKPTEGTATTASVRANFAAAKAEIEELQAAVIALFALLP